MPSQETYRSYLESPSDRWRGVPKAVRNLYRDERAFQLYQDFKAKYAGEPYHATHPMIIRDRGGQTITYDMPVLSAITTRGDHLIHLAAGNGGKMGGIDPRLQFFVVTADFNTFDMTEWWLSDVRANSIGQPSKLELFLSHQPVHEVPQKRELDTTKFMLDAMDEVDIAEQEQLDAEARAIKYVYENQRSTLSWGDGRAPSIFVNLFDVEAGLYLLYQAEKTGQFGSQPIGHQRVIEHLERAA